MADDTRSFPDQYMLRFPPGMRDRLKAVAKANGRSLNIEIITRLEDSLGVPGPEGSAQNALEQVQTMLAGHEEERAQHAHFVDEVSRRIDDLLNRLKDAVGDTTKP